MSNPKISVILPIYNVEDYLESCLDSILNQTMIDDIEVLMIDDGSTDKSRYIIEKYALDHDNFHAYHKENEGQAISRNYGFSLAKGDFVHFLDADDYLDFNTYEKTYNFAVDNDNDFTIFNVCKFTENTIWKDIIFKNSYKSLSDDVKSTSLYESNFLVWNTLSTNKLFKREFLEKFDLKFLNRRILYEDIIFSFRAYNHAKSIGIVCDDFYFWRVRNNNDSITQNLSNFENFENRFFILKQVSNVLKEMENDEVAAMLYLKWLNHDFTMYLKRIHTLPEDYQRKVVSCIQDFMKSIPQSLISNLNGFYQLLYKSLLEDDLENLVRISAMDSDAIEHIENHEIYKKYGDEIDFNAAFDYEELIAETTDLNHDDNNLIIDLDLFIHYVPKEDTDKIAFTLENDNKEYDLEYKYIDGLYQITVPVDLITEENSKVKVIYSKKDLEKTAYLRTNGRYALNFDNFEVNVVKSTNRDMILYSRKLNENEVHILNIEFEDDFLRFDGESKETFNSMVIENLADLDKSTYDVEYTDSTNFTFKIPFEDLIGKPVIKWEVKPDGVFNSIKTNYFQLFKGIYQVRFLNQRNRFVINIKNYKTQNVVDYYKNLEYKLSDDIKRLEKENKRLTKDNDKLLDDKNKLLDENKDLKNTIDMFKSRKIVRFADKFHR